MDILDKIMIFVLVTGLWTSFLGMRGFFTKSNLDKIAIRYVTIPCIVIGVICIVLHFII